ncbi:uncharacterized protein LOC142201079 [Leptodactylus fuscus]|uniref:uncharacterized protein LOC142201079 n=1 Tax=Leptodactylus fuscus TaxID=238119 RepID=UPI003F4ED876
MAGPFLEPPLAELKVSPLGVVPKKEPNKFRMIHHLSFPEGSSVNEGIDPELCSVVYTSFDAAIEWVRHYVGPFSITGSRGGSSGEAVAGGIVEAAARAVDGLVRSSLVQGTWLSYESAWGLWEGWLRFLGEGWEDAEMALMLWVGHCHELGWSVSRMNRFMAGMAFGFRSRGVRDITKSFLVRQAIKGWRRSGGVADTRRPVSFQLLCQLGVSLDGVCSSGLEITLFRAAFSLAFFGALRIGELVSSSKNKPGGLLFEDVDIYGDRVEFRIRRCKTDQVGKGKVLYGVPGCRMCPVLCLGEYVAGRGGGLGPLLVHADGSYLSRFQFVRVFRFCLRSIGLQESDYSGHSFRIGAATEAARRGLGDDVVKRIGRWESRRFQLYVRPHLL